jgi:hypothetical protein
VRVKTITRGLHQRTLGCLQRMCSGKSKAKKCTLVQALRLCKGRTAHKGNRVIAILFLEHGTRRGEGSASRPGRFLPPGKTRHTLNRRLGGPQGRSGQVRKISPPTAIRSPDRPTRSQSLYRLRYPAHRGSQDQCEILVEVRWLRIMSNGMRCNVLS